MNEQTKVRIKHMSSEVNKLRINVDKLQNNIKDLFII